MRIQRNLSAFFKINLPFFMYCVAMIFGQSSDATTENFTYAVFFFFVLIRRTHVIYIFIRSLIMLSLMNKPFRVSER